MRHEQALLDQLGVALAAFAHATDVRGIVVAREAQTTGATRADAVVEFTVNGKKYRYAVEAKTRVDRLAALGHIKQQLAAHKEKRGLLFAPYITAAIARQCRQIDLEFLDAAGNAYLNLPGMHVYILGEKPEGLATPALGATGGGTATALRVVFALLCRTALLNAPYREIVDAAGVALGAIGWVFYDLQGRGYVAGGQMKRNRRFIDPVRLFEEWVTNYPIKLRPKLNPRRFRAENADWWQTTPLHNLGAYWGGEVAAARLAQYLKPAAYTIYMKPERFKDALPKLVARHRLQADPGGNIEILEAFWNLPDDPTHPDVVPPILAYADLVATLDPRNLEAAKLIRTGHIENALRKA